VVEAAVILVVGQLKTEAAEETALRGEEMRSISLCFVFHVPSVLRLLLGLNPTRRNSYWSCPFKTFF
jgi:hypothetical protein